jgi:hypothetical protein
VKFNSNTRFDFLVSNKKEQAFVEEWKKLNFD